MIKKIVDRYLKGQSITRVASSLGVSRSFVFNVLKRNGIEKRSPGLPAGEDNPRRRFTDKQEIIICEEYKNGKTLKECGKKYKAAQTVISRILKRHGYQTRISKETGKVGKYCSRYMGSIFYNKKGYRCLYKPDYKWCHKGGWIQEHRYVMQEHLGRELRPNEHVHHINGIKTDNRLENLMLMTDSEHSKFHNRKEIA